MKAVNKQKAEVAQFKKQFEGPTVASRLPKGGYVTGGGDPRHNARGTVGSGNSGSSGGGGGGGGGGLPKPRLIAANGLTDDQKQEQARKRAQVSSRFLLDRTFSVCFSFQNRILVSRTCVLNLVILRPIGYIL